MRFSMNVDLHCDSCPATVPAVVTFAAHDGPAPRSAHIVGVGRLPPGWVTQSLTYKRTALCPKCSNYKTTETAK